MTERSTDNILFITAIDYNFKLSGVKMKNEDQEKENKTVDTIGIILFGAMILAAIVGVIWLLFV